MNFQHQSIPPLSEHPRDSGSQGDVRRAHALAALLFDAGNDADAEGRISPETWRMLHQSGLLMACFPAPQGGSDLGAPRRHADLAAVLRLMGWGDLSVARLFEGHVNAVALVCRYGTPSQVADLAAAVRAGAVSAVWGAEDALGLKAEPDGTRWRLAGRKILASGAGYVTHPVVTARAGAEQRLFLPRLKRGERIDLTGWTAQGMRSSATGTVDFSGMTLSDDQRLGQDGDFLRQPHFSGGAWRFCAVHLGATERLMDLFRDHLVSRQRESDPYQLQRMAQGGAAVTTAAFWVAEAARRLADDAEEPERAVAFVNLTRMVTERAALDVLEAVHRGTGLQAFMRPHPIERVSRDLSTYLRQPVPDLAMADAGRAILASTRQTGDLWNRAA